MADAMERNALRNAQANASQVEMLVDQATRISPVVQPVGRVNIAQGSVSFLSFFALTSLLIHYRAIMSDIFFDNFFTDMAFHSNINTPFYLSCV